MNAFRPLAVLAPILLAASLAPAAARAASEDPASMPENAEARINYSGKLRMLSQRIPSAACHLSRDIAPEASRALLQSAAAEFEKILHALEFGDGELGIEAPERNRKTLQRIHLLRDEWEILKGSAAVVAAGTATEGDMDAVLAQNMAVLAQAVRLVPWLVNQYSNPNDIPLVQLLLVDISGRQRMLTQKISKEACILDGGGGTDVSEDLEETIRLFEASLEALRFGLDVMDIPPPPNREIVSGLDIVAENWSVVKPLLEATLGGADPDADANAARFHGLNETMARMNDVVGLYADVAREASTAPL